MIIIIIIFQNKKKYIYIVVFVFVFWLYILISLSCAHIECVEYKPQYTLHMKPHYFLIEGLSIKYYEIYVLHTSIFLVFEYFLNFQYIIEIIHIHYTLQKSNMSYRYIEIFHYCSIECDSYIVDADICFILYSA